MTRFATLMRCVNRRYLSFKYILDKIPGYLVPWKKYELIVDAFEGQLYVASKDYVLQRVNKRVIDTLGYDPKGMHCYAALRNRESPCLDCVMGAVLLDVVIRQEQCDEKTGHWYQVVHAPVRYPFGGIMKLTTKQDITELKETAFNLKQTGQAYRSLLDDVHDVVFKTNANGEWLFLSKAWEEITGFTVEESLGRSFYHFVHPDERKAVLNSFVSAVERRMEDVRRRVRYVAKDGSARWFEINAHVRYGVSGGAIESSGVMRNVTGDVNFEEYKARVQRVKSIATIAAEITHAFNNYAQIISANCEALLDEIEPGHTSVRNKLLGVKNAIEKTQVLTKRVLPFAYNKEAEVSSNIDYSWQIKKLFSSMQNSLHWKGLIEFVMNLNSTFKMKANSTHLDQVVLNLVFNARDAMPEGGVLTVTTENVTVGEDFLEGSLGLKDGRYVALTVEDTGVGIPPENLDKLFDRSYTTKESEENTGMGLAIVQDMVNIYHGVIRYKSEVGKGTVFTVYFPAMEEQRERATLIPFPRGGYEKILVVDDEEIILDVTAGFLHKYGYEVFRASCGEEAYEVYNANQDIALVVTDLAMPGIGGNRLIKDLIELNPALKILVITGLLNENLFMESVRKRVKGVLTKPFLCGELLNTVRKILDRKEDGDEQAGAVL
jgi:two-component system cell cycle sensor histidine kinase/response regulator CckA